MTEASRRTLEIWTAICIALVGAIVAAESLTHDIGWNDTGPGPGYFPFRVGLLLTAAALGLSLQNLRTTASAPFVTRDEFRRALSVFAPTAVLVTAMYADLGCYVPSAAYLAWMMRRHGGYGWARAAAWGIAVMAVFFLVFDVWFRVPLDKGPVEAMLGLH
jgi:hypothetical protein